MTDTFLEHSWVLECLLDIVYDLKVTCLDDYYRTRAVHELAGKWSCEHAMMTLLFQSHFGPINAGLRSLLWAVHVADMEAVESMVDKYAEGKWGTATKTQPCRPVDIELMLLTENPYHHDEFIPALSLNDTTVLGSDAFDLGAWSHIRFLDLSPNVSWAILRARKIATTGPPTVDARVFSVELKRLLGIIMEVSQPQGLA
jgi:hypothetical protein